MKDQIKTILMRRLDLEIAELFAVEIWNLIFEAKVLSTTEEFRNDLICAVQDKLFGEGNPDD